jgi:hypothetical protein
MEEVTQDMTPEYVQKTLQFPAMIWNAVVMKRWGKSADYIQEIIDQLRKNGAPPEIATLGEPMVKLWVQRKKELFPEEMWGIEDVVVYKDFSDQLIIRVVARAPEEFKHQLPTHQASREYSSTLN